jgi:hypothetical protein
MRSVRVTGAVYLKGAAIAHSSDIGYRVTLECSADIDQEILSAVLSRQPCPARSPIHEYHNQR